MQKKTMPAPGSELELVVSDLNTDGSAVAKENGVVFFIDAGLPGERLLARVESVKKNVVLASRLAVLEPSPDETEPFCGYFGDCGGCLWQNLKYEAQLAWKRSRVEAALRRIAKVDIEVPPLSPSPQLRAFRNKMEYAFGGEGDGGLALGLRRRASREVCQIDECPLQSAGSGQVLAAVLGWARENGFSAWNGESGALRHLVLHESAEAGGPVRMAELVCGGTPPSDALLQDLYARLEPLSVVSFTVSQRKDKAPLASGSRVLRRFGQDGIFCRIGHLNLEFPAQGFVQTNSAAAAVLYEQARELAALKSGESLWDIYCGVGALGLYMADKDITLAGVELVGASVGMAQKNAAALGFDKSRFIKGDAVKILPGMPGRPDVLAVDPPRGGLHPRLAASIIKKAPRRIIYVSCDPATLARDIAALAPAYALAAVRSVDMFPHTPHVECMALLELVK